jgi:putative spermidine/putrescine transport system substrate-binding protein
MSSTSVKPLRRKSQPQHRPRMPASVGRRPAGRTGSRSVERQEEEEIVRRSVVWLVMLAIVSILVVAACGGDDEEGAEEAQTTVEAPSESAVPDLTGTTLTFAGFGGSTQEAQTKAWETPFEELTGATIQTDLVDYAKLRAQVESGNVTWDLVEADTFFVNQECGKLFLPRDPAIVKSIDNALPGTISNECGVPIVASATVFAYDADKFGDDPPQAWADFFDTEKYPGKRSIWNYALNGMPEAALLADGVPPDQLYPLDIERAFKKLRTIKSHILFAETLAQQQEQLTSGQAAIAMIFTGRLLGAIKEGAKFEALWNQNLRNWDNIAVVKGSKNVDASMYYLEYLLNPAVQNRLTLYSPYTSVLQGPAPKTDSLTAQYLANDPEHYKVGIDINPTWWGEHFDEMSDAWTSFASG